MARIMRGNRIIVVIIMTLFIAVCLEASAAGDAGLRKQFEQMVSKLAGMPVSVKDYRMDYSTVHLTGINIGNPADPQQVSATIGSLSATCDFMSLMGGNLVLKEISIESCKARLPIKRQPEQAGGKKRQTASASQPLHPADLPFSQIKVLNLNLSIIDADSGMQSVMEIPATSINRTSDSKEVRANLAGRIMIDTSRKNSSTPPEISASCSLALVLAGNLRNPDTTIDLKLADGNCNIPDKKLSMQNVSAGLSAKGQFDRLVIVGNILAASGKIEVALASGSSSTFAFPFTNMVAPVRFSGGKLSVENARTSLFGGTISGDGTVFTDKVPLRFEFEAAGSGIQAENFLAQNSTQQQAISGPIDANLMASGDVTGLNSLNGKGNLRMQNGRYQTPPVISPFLKIANLAEFSSGDLQDASGTFVLDKGILTTSDLAASTAAGLAFYRGNIGLDTSLQGRLELRFAAAAVRKSDILRQISTDGVSAAIPTTVEGSLLAPVFPGFSLGGLLEFGLKKQGQKLLQDMINPGAKSPDSGQQKKNKGILGDLQNIFKKKKSSGDNLAPATNTAPVKKEDPLKKGLKNLFKF